MELFKASNQWATRPSDERFDSLTEMYAACHGYYKSAGEKKHTPMSTLRTEASNGEVMLVGKANQPSRISHWAFGQLSTRIGAPAGYLRELPATLACQNINHGLAYHGSNEDGGVANLLFHQNGTLLLRAFVSDRYERIWNHEIVHRLLDLETRGWKPAMPTIRKTANDRPALYASDHDMFAFLMYDSYGIKEAGNPDGLRRGVFVENSEVGASALKLTRFYFRDVCGNFIVWGASNVCEIKVRHVGDARSRWGLYEREIGLYLRSSAQRDEERIASAQRTLIGDSKDKVIDKLFGVRSLGLSRKTIEAGYDAVNREQDGDPRSVWGVVQGLTRHSQAQTYADARVAIDRAAGKIMEVSF